MNDKEKLISFINKGKENKPVKEVHVIKDSPTEAHILLVNEDGTNVASNRFEIMDAHDLMTLIENPEYTGLNIEISNDNKKVIISNDYWNTFAFIYLGELYIDDDPRWHTLYNFIQQLGRWYEDGNLNFFCRRAFMQDYLIDQNDETKRIPFTKLLSDSIQLITIEGSIGNTSGTTLLRFEFDSEEGSVSVVLSDGTITSYVMLSEYNIYKQENGELYVGYEY